MIADVTSDKVLSGTLSENTSLPLVIQSFLDKKAWTISSGISVDGNAFSTTLANALPKWDVSYGTNKAFSVNRNT